MTTGSSSSNDLTTQTTLLNGSPSGTNQCGRSSSVQWVGSDSPFEAPSYRPPPMKYWTVDSQLRPVLRTIRPARLPRKRLLVPNPFIKSWDVVFKPPGGQSVRYKDLNGTDFLLSYAGYNAETLFSYDGVLPVPPPPALDANDDLKLINKLYEQVKGGSFNLGTFLGEGHESLKMIAGAATTLFESYRAVRKGDVVKAARRLMFHHDPKSPIHRRLRGLSDRGPSAHNTVAANWLELSFGWLPILSDMDAAAQLLANHLHRPRSVRFYAQVTKKVSEAEILAYHQSVSTNKVFQSCYSVSRKQIIGIFAESSLSWPVYTGLADVGSIAWELTPLSFLADYVIPIGDYLTARSAASQLQGTFVISTKSSWGAAGLAVTGPVIGSGYTLTTESLDARYLRKVGTFTRSVTTSLDVPLPVVKPVEKVASWQHCVNALALLTQAFRAS